MPGPDILAALVAGTKAKAGDLNDKFDSIKDWGSDIPLTDLADQTPGALLIANGSGVVTGAVASGAVSISNAGVTALGFSYAHQGLDTNIPNAGGFSNIDSLSITPAAGRWALLSKIVINSGISTGLGLMVSRLNNGSAIDVCTIEGNATGTDYLTMVNMAVADFNGSTAVVVEAGGFATNTIVTKADQGGWLMGLRVS